MPCPLFVYPMLADYCRGPTAGLPQCVDLSAGAAITQHLSDLRKTAGIFVDARPLTKTDTLDKIVGRFGYQFFQSGIGAKIRGSTRLAAVTAPPAARNAGGRQFGLVGGAIDTHASISDFREQARSYPVTPSALPFRQTLLGQRLVQPQQRPTVPLASGRRVDAQ